MDGPVTMALTTVEKHTVSMIMGALKGELFYTKILAKSSLSLAHCALNRSFTVIFQALLA